MNNVSGSGDFDNDLSRRNVLKSAAGGAAGFAGVSQAAITWAQPTEEELSELRDEPNVRAVLSELGLHRLPDGMQKISSSLDEGEESPTFELWEGQVEYGTLHVGRIDDLTNVVFEFAEDFQSTAPRRFRSIPEGTEPLVSAEEGEAFVKRSATEREEAAINRLLPVTGSKITHTATNLDGFQVNLVRQNEETDELEQLRFGVQVDSGDDDSSARETARTGRRRHGSQQDDVHPVFKESSRALEDPSNTTVRAQGLLDDATEAVNDVQKAVQKSYINWDGGWSDVKWWLNNTHKPWKKLPDDVTSTKNLSRGAIKNVVASFLIEEGLEYAAGECGEDCANCGLTATDLLLNCHKCRIFLGAGISSTGPAGLVLFIICVWNFCNFPKAIDSCSSCIECATDAAEEYV